jgi:hypothetical protein
MMDEFGRTVNAGQIIAAVKSQLTGVRVHRQPTDVAIDVLRQVLRQEASSKHIRVVVDHVDEDVLLVIPMRQRPTSTEVYAAMNMPTGF